MTRWDLATQLSYKLGITKEEAENVVAGGKFAPIGQRGMTTSRQGYGVPNFLEIANDKSLLVILIEDIVAYNNLDSILEVDDIDVFFVAPGDFAQSIRQKTTDRKETAWYNSLFRGRIGGNR